MQNFKNELNTRNWSVNFDLKRLPVINDIIGFDGADISGGFKEIPSGNSIPLKEPSSRSVTYDDVTIGFIVDDLMRNHEQIKEWLENNNAPEGKVIKDTTGAVFSLTDDKGKIKRKLKFMSVFPINLTFPSFKVNEKGEIDNIAYVTLAYSKWNYVPLKDTKKFFK